MMHELFKDKEHLVRMAGLFTAGLVVFLVLRGVLVPADFGELGHFRTGALGENIHVERHFAGRAACEMCHDDIAEERLTSAHAGIGCEACHSAQAAHADDPEAAEPVLPEANPLCTSCHQVSVAKPEWFPQVDAEEHSDGETCLECHMPHDPGI